MSTNSINLVYFARIREQIGKADEVIDIPADVLSAEQLIAHLRSLGEPYSSALSIEANIRMAFDQELVTADTKLEATREVAFFPPMTGG